MDTAIVMPTRHKLDAGTYFRMAEAGVFPEQDRIELIEGDLIDMAPTGHDHAVFVSFLVEAFVLACAGRATVWTQSSVWLDRYTAPEPDIAILRRRADYYASKRPGPADIAELWIIDVARAAIEIYTQPVMSAYAATRIVKPGDQVALTLAPEILVTLDPIFAAL